MATAPVHPRTSLTYHDDNAHAYLHSLQQGQFPDIRPECGRWEPAVAYIEKRLKLTSNPAGVAPHLFKSVLSSGKFPGLAELLSGAPRKQASQAEPELKTAITAEQGGIPGLPTYAQIASEKALGACPPLDWYEEYSKQASDRAFPGYHPFCGLWLFSSIAGRRVSLQVNAKEFNTNLMLGLVAETSFSAKSFTANIAKQVMYKLGLDYRLGPDRMTHQKLLSDMSGKYIPTDYDDLSQLRQDEILHTLAVPGQKGLLFDEMGKFIQGTARKNSTSAEFIDLLLTLNDCPPVFRPATITRGSEPIDKPYISLLGCMTPSNLRELARAGAEFWQDGFWARISFIVAPPPPKETEDPGPPVFKRNKAAIEVPQHLLAALQEWDQRLGVPEVTLEPKLDKKGEPTGTYTFDKPELPHTECEITDEAAQAWTNYDHALNWLKSQLPHKDFYGSYARLPETAMRIAILLASLSNNNVIELKHWARAQELAELLRGYLHELYAQVNTGDEKPSYAKTVEDKVLAYINKFSQETEDKDKIPTIRNMSRYIKNIDIKALRGAVIDLKQAEVLAEKRVGKAVYYVCSEDG